MSKQCPNNDKNKERAFLMIRRSLSENLIHWQNELNRMKSNLLEVSELYRKTQDVRFLALIEAYSMGIQALVVPRYSFMDLQTELINSVIEIEYNRPQPTPFVLPR